MKPMPAAMPAELAERLADTGVPEYTSAEEDRAIESIIEDYLLMGQTYPVHGPIRIDAGAWLRDQLSEREIEDLIRVAIRGGGIEFMEHMAIHERTIREQAPSWIRKHYMDLVRERADELMEASQ